MLGRPRRGHHPGGWGVLATPPSLAGEITCNMLSLFVQVNFVLFVSIIRILLQKLTSPDIGGNDQSQYK